MNSTTKKDETHVRSEGKNKQTDHPQAVGQSHMTHHTGNWDLRRRKSEIELALALIAVIGILRSPQS